MGKVNKYQYETSPRKYEPNYAPTRKKNNNKILEQKKKEQEKLKKQKAKKAKMIKYLIIGFSIIFAICYRNAKIDEKFSEIKDLKAELNNIEKENTQIQVAIESGLNLINLEQSAKELLGMQRLSTQQTIYADLKKTDYIATAAENVIIKEETTWDKVTNAVKQLFK